MLGILRPYKMEMLVKDCTYYKLYYCSVCRHLVRNNSRPYAFVNSYEGTLLAMLYNEMVVQDIEAVKDRCSGLPIAKVPVLPPEHEAVRLGAFISLLAFQVKFQDNLQDETGFWISQYNRFLHHRLTRSLNNLNGGYEEFGIDLNLIRKEQEELNRMERDTSFTDIESYLKLWGDLFSYIMTEAFRGKIDPHRLEPLRSVFSSLGKIINLIDSMTDLHQDIESGQFNLILRAEGAPENSNEAWFHEKFEHYRARVLSESQQALKVLPQVELNESYPIIQNVLTHRLDMELKNVFDYMVNRKQKSERLLFNCRDF